MTREGSVVHRRDRRYCDCMRRNLPTTCMSPNALTATALTLPPVSPAPSSKPAISCPEVDSGEVSWSAELSHLNIDVFRSRGLPLFADVIWSFILSFQLCHWSLASRISRWRYPPTIIFTAFAGQEMHLKTSPL